MRFTFTLLLLILAVAVEAQVQNAAQSGRYLHAANKLMGKDTTTESDTSKENKEPQYFYISANTNIFVNTKGGAAKRFSPTVEFGRTYGIFDIGLGIGKLNMLKGNDTARYIELRPTINVFSKGRFAESLCLGAGYVISAKQGLMSEICNGINFNVSTTFAIAMVQGYVFFDGTNSNRTAQYIGVNLTYNFLKPHSVNKQRKKKAILNDN
ncbi:MAG TPA: hypothetical protein VNX40_15070 [Mucilaginibacter sp.]|jgi:hypothetical protein|nr:hypothetical protein [Mucilaginibacter sp.]